MGTAHQGRRQESVQVFEIKTLKDFVNISEILFRKLVLYPTELRDLSNLFIFELKPPLYFKNFKTSLVFEPFEKLWGWIGDRPQNHPLARPSPQPLKSYQKHRFWKQKKRIGGLAQKLAPDPEVDSVKNRSSQILYQKPSGLARKSQPGGCHG